MITSVVNLPYEERVIRAKRYAHKYNCPVQEILDRWHVAKQKAARAIKTGDWTPDVIEVVPYD